MEIQQKIIEKIKEYNTIICLRHVSPDGDAYGSTMGLKQFILDNFPEKKVYTDGENVDYLNFMGFNDQPTQKDYENALVIICDTANTARIDSKYWSLAKYIIKIDHHEKGEKYGNLEYLDDFASAACELVSQLLITSKLIVSKKTAKFLYTGIVTDSNRFMYPTVSKDTFRIANFLLSCGVDISHIYKNLYSTSFNALKFKAYLIENAILTKKGVAYVKIKDDVLKQYNIEREYAKSMVNVLADINEIKIWLFLNEYPELNCIRVSIRSRKYVVNEIASRYEGGGHKLAAGAKLASWEQLDDLIADLENLIVQNNVVDS